MLLDHECWHRVAALFIKTTCMKSLLLPAVCMLSLGALAQKSISTKQSINDDSRQLSIVINGEANGKTIEYDRVFDVTGMPHLQQNASTERVYDIPGLPSPLPAHIPVVSIPPARDVPPVPPVPVISAKTAYTGAYTSGGHHPYTKEIKYNPQAGLPCMKYRLIKNGEESCLKNLLKQKANQKKNGFKL